MEEKQKKKILGLAFIVAVFFVLSAGFALYPVLAAYPAIRYAPGETTDPNCSPGDANCNVYAPITTDSVDDYAVSSLSGGSGFVVSSPTGTVVLSLDIDSTLTTSTKLGLNLSNANTWLEVQTFSASTTMASTSITYLTSNNVNITGGSLSGVTGNISMWTNNANYLTTSTEADQVWIAASSSYAKLSSNNVFTGTTNTFSNAIFNGSVSFSNGIYDNATTSVLSISSDDRMLYAKDGATPVLRWGLNNSLVWGNGAGANQSDAEVGHYTNYDDPHGQILGNIFIGNLAGNAVTDGNEGDVFIGNNAGQSAIGNEQVAENTYVGHMSGGLNTTGFYNAYFGGRAGRANTTGYANTFMGWAAGEYGTTLNNYYGTYLGVEAARWGGGNNNTAVGARSGFSTIQDHGGLGSANTMVGVYTGQSANDAGPWAAINYTTLVGYAAGSMDQADGLTAIGFQAGTNNTTGNLNTFLGYNSGQANTTGSNNTLLGYNAGKGNVTGSSITAIGTYADQHDTLGGGVYIGYLTAFTNVTGTSNVYVGNQAGQYANSSNGTFIGDLAGNANTSGAGNTFIGKNAGYSNTSGGDSTIVGYNAGYGITSGSRMVLLGEYAGRSITSNNDLIAIGNYAGNSNTGGNSIYLGYLSGFNNITGTGNIFIGNYAGRYQTGSNKFIVDNQDRTNMNGDETSALLNGTFNATPSLQTLTINGKVGIATTTPAAFLHVLGTTEQLRLGYNASNYTSFTVGADGALTITPTNSATTTISGVLAATGGNSTNWNTAHVDRLKWDGGATDLVAATGRTSLGLGSMALATTTDYANLSLTNIFTGSNTFATTTASTSTVTGVLYLANGTVTAPSLAFTSDLDSGLYLIGESNLGVTVSSTKILDISSTAVYNSTGKYGLDSTDYIVFANNNNQTFYVNGTYRFVVNTSGVEFDYVASRSINTSLSFKSYENDDASAVGFVYDTNSSLTTAGGKLAQWKNATAAKAYIDYLGGMFVATGTAALPSLGATADTDTGIYWPSANNLALSTSGTERMRIDSNGYVGIGTTTPAYIFQVQATTASGYVGSDGTWGTTSDERLKKNIVILDGALEKLMQLRGVRFDWKADESAISSTHIGFIAQEVESIFPQFVSAGSDGIKGVAYGALTPVLVEAIKEQQGEIANLALVLPANFTSSTLNGMKIDDNVLTTEIITGQELNNFDWLVKNTLKKLGMLIKDSVAKFKELIAGKITAQNELCVGSTCVNEEQLKNLLNNSGTGYTTATNLTPDSNNPTPQPENGLPMAETSIAPVSESTATTTIESPTSDTNDPTPTSESTTSIVEISTPDSISQTPTTEMPVVENLQELAVIEPILSIPQSEAPVVEARVESAPVPEVAVPENPTL